MNFTDNALKQFKKLIIESENPNSGIRFFTVQGCCSPLLQMQIAANPVNGDHVVQMDGMNIFTTPEAEKIISGITIDFADEVFKTIKTPDTKKEGSCC